MSLRVASMLAVAGIALAGCAGKPGAAAVVDGRTISEDYLAEATAGTNPYLNSPFAPADMLGALIQAPVTLEVASEHGVAVSQGEAVEMLDSIAEAGGEPAPEEYADGTVQFVRMVLANDAILSSEDAEAISAQIMERISEADVTINPRYGEWDGRSITPLTPEWLVDTAPPAAE